MNEVVVPCPVCGEPLPPLELVLDGPSATKGTEVEVLVSVAFSDVWWARARRAHSPCFNGRDRFPELVAA